MKLKRQAVLIIADILGIHLSFLLALYIHNEGHIPSNILLDYGKIAVFITVIKMTIFNRLQMYNSIWEYASIEELMKVAIGVFSSALISVLLMANTGPWVYPGVYMMAMVFEFMYIGGERFAYRIIRRIRNRQSIVRQETKEVLIIGSGSTACIIANEIKNHPKDYGHVAGFIDDDSKRLYKTIGGVKILGNRYDIYSIVKQFAIEEIIIAAPTSNNAAMKEIISECKRTSAKVRIIPGMKEMIDGSVSMSHIRDVEIEDLLGREPIEMNIVQIATYIEDNTILVTGGGGSIGSELCRQIARFTPKRLVILDIYENNAYDIQNELTRCYPKLDLDVIIASVRDRENIFRLIAKIQPDIIFHAAAHKHVPLMERMPMEAIKNNTFGTMNVAEAAKEYGVSRFVLISTDKAVNPTNVMGVSKRLCEMIVQGLATTGCATRFVAVRFGNVLGSNGSVIPLFKRQIKEGGPVTVTHKEIIRYFMTIPEASQLVLQAGAIAEGGEIFVLDMGEPVRIYNLAEDLIRLSGFKPHEDIKIEITGLRPGEKLYEELLMKEEGLTCTNYKKIHIGQPFGSDYKMLHKSLMELKDIIDREDTEEFMAMLHFLVPTYRSNTEVNDENGHMKEGNHRYQLVEY